MSDSSAMKIAVIGGGIAGASAAWALINHPSQPEVVLLEAEAQLAHHTTGRSAAQLVENYGAAAIRPLTKVSVPFLRDPGVDYWDQPILSPQMLMMIGRSHQDDLVTKMLAAGKAANPSVTEISVAEAAEMFPPLRTEMASRVVVEPESSNIDVAGLHQLYVRGFRAANGQITVSTRVDAATRDGSGAGAAWRLETTDGVRHADVIVNAAGAWGDRVAATAGVESVGLTPMRRTAFMVDSKWPDSSSWAMLHDAESTWYLKPDGPQFLCSPADETPSEPMDAKPMEIDIAIAIDRINEMTTLDIRSVSSSWAGLRTFAPDRSMVIGPDPEHEDFVWCVGQGGTGIQTSPAACQLLADVTLDGRPGPLFDDVGLDLAGLSPDRFRSG